MGHGLVPLVLHSQIAGPQPELQGSRHLEDVLDQEVEEGPHLHIEQIVLVGDLDSQNTLNSLLVVSLYEATGSDFFIGMQA